jgi:ligand-binding sensor domain-containing protein
VFWWLVAIACGGSAVAAPAPQSRAAWQSGADAAIPRSLVDVEARAVEVTSTGDIWVSVRERGLVQIRGGEASWFTVGDGLPFTGIADLHEDARGRLWAVGVDGFAILEGGSWRSQGSVGELRPRVIFNVFEEPGGDAIWLATSTGAGRFEDGAWSYLRAADGLPHEVVHDVVVDASGSVWLACRSGLARLQGGEVEVVFTAANFRTALVGADGTLWFGSSDGIYAWDGSSWARYLEGKTVYTRLLAADGAIWAGSASSGVFRHASGVWEAIELPAWLQGAEVFDLAQDRDGSIWLATAAGLGRLVAATAGDARAARQPTPPPAR